MRHTKKNERPTINKRVNRGRPADDQILQSVDEVSKITILNMLKNYVKYIKMDKMGEQKGISPERLKL